MICDLLKSDRHLISTPVHDFKLSDRPMLRRLVQREATDYCAVPFGARSLPARAVRARALVNLDHARSYTAVALRKVMRCLATL